MAETKPFIGPQDGSPNRPRGSYQKKPVQIEGTLYHSSKVLDGTWIGKDPLSAEETDQFYANLFWSEKFNEYNSSKQYQENKRKVMLTNLERAVVRQAGIFSRPVHETGMDERDKAVWAAYRVLGREHGYELGLPTVNEIHRDIASAPITRISNF